MWRKLPLEECEIYQGDIIIMGGLLNCANPMDEIFRPFFLLKGIRVRFV